MNKTLICALITFSILLSSVFAIIPTNEEVLQAIEDDPDLYRMYHDSPEKLIEIFEERTYLWDYYQSVKDNPPTFRELDLTDDEMVTFKRNILLHAIKDNKLTVNLDPSTFSPDFQNAKLRIKLSDGTIIGVVIQNNEITKLQIGALKEFTHTVLVSKQAENYVLGGQTNLELLLNKEITYTKNARTEIPKSNTLIGNAFHVSLADDTDTTSNGFNGLLIMILTGIIGIIGVFYFSDKKKYATMVSVIFMLVLISSCDMCDGKADVIYNLDDDEYDAIGDAYFQGVYNMPYVEMLVEYANTDAVFDHDGNTGVEAFMDEVELAKEVFYYDFYDAGYIFGYYEEDYPEEAWGFYTDSLFCHEAIGINLDELVLGQISGGNLFHEGIHAAITGHGRHSDEVNTLLDELGSVSYFDSSDFMQQIIEDEDIAYLISAYFYIVEEIMRSEPDWCDAVADHLIFEYEHETASSEEMLEDMNSAKESLAAMDTESWASLLAGCMYGDEYDIITSTQTGLLSCYDISAALDYLGITEEELTEFIIATGHVDDWNEICENEFDELEEEIGCFEGLYLGESLSECSYPYPATYVFAQDDALAPTADDYLFIDSSSGQYIADGSSGTDISFDFVYDEFDIIYFFIDSFTSARIILIDEEGYVQFPLAADASSTAGEASDEPIYWGNEAPTATNPYQNELMYLEGETCTGITSVADCQGAMFMFIDVYQHAHLIEMTSIDTVSNLIYFEDLGAEVSLGDAGYTDGTATSISLTSLMNFELVIDETAKTITFADIGSSDGAVFMTSGQASFEIINTDLDSQIFEGLIFSEYEDGVVSSYITDLSITAVYDDAIDDIIKIDTTPFLSLSSADGYGWYYESSTNHDTQVFKTWKGTNFELRRDSILSEELSLHISPPYTSTYGVVHVEPEE